VKATETVGVFMASFGNNESAVVIKSTPDPLASLYSFMLLDAMGHLRVPACKVINAGDSEFKMMLFAMEKASLGDEDLRLKIRSTMNRPFIVVQEFVPGFDLTQIREDRAKLLFHPDTMRQSVLHENQTAKVHGYKAASAVAKIKEGPLIQLGKIIATDIMMNNSDRVNAIWSNSGNPANLHVEVEIGPMKQGKESGLRDPFDLHDLQIKSLVAIDNQTFPISVAGAKAGSHSYNVLQDYLKTIESFIKGLFADVRRLRGS